jgi:hypothetical protein
MKDTQEFSKAVNRMILISLVVGVILLFITSCVIRDIDFIKEKPLAFALELLCMSVIPAFAIVIVFAFTRGINFKDSIVWLAALVAKFALFHILCQVSGVYTAIFLHNSPKN